MKLSPVKLSLVKLSLVKLSLVKHSLAHMGLACAVIAALAPALSDLDRATRELEIERQRYNGQLDAVGELEIQTLMSEDPQLSTLPMLRREALPILPPLEDEPDRNEK